METPDLKLGFSPEEIADFIGREPEQDTAYWQRQRIIKDEVTRILTGASVIINLHLAQYFRVRREPQEILELFAKAGLGQDFDPINTPMDIREQMWVDKQADPDGIFTFPAQTLILGHTEEEVIIPLNEMWRMRTYFCLESTGQMLPLTTNLTAPLLKPGSKGPQTYEIYNEGTDPLTIRVSDLICPTDAVVSSKPLTSLTNAPGIFGIQEKGKIRLGNSW